MATLADARTRWITENPRVPPETQANYDARADAAAYVMLSQMGQEETEATRIAVRKKYRAAKTMLDAPVGTTAADVRQAVVQHRTILSGLIEALKDAGILLDD